MYFPKYWALARKGGVCSWGWSDVSTEAARAAGLQRVERSIAWLQNDMAGERGAYGYPDRPMREEIIREFRDAAGALSAVVSRNSYGCLVLNTTGMLFVDVDERAPGLLARLFKKSDFEADLLAQARTWVDQYPGWGWRLYRTRAGVRLLATHQPIGSAEPICGVAFKFFKADWLYQKLCVNQKCFRARLTPKPWRCGVVKPEVRWPWKDAKAEAVFRRWETDYTQAAGSFSVCRLIGQVGSAAVHPNLSALLKFHDAETRVDSSLPLA